MKPILAALALSFCMPAVAMAAPSCRGAGAERVDVGDHRLWMQTSGVGTPTVVFESGGGEDSSAWTEIAPKVADHNHVRTVVYDRAGLGKSELQPGAYSIDGEVAALKRALDLCDVRGPVVLVAHSYGGFIAELLAADDRRVAGVVLVDANLASFFDEKEVQHLLAKYTPQFDGLRQAKPELARVMIPMMQAYPETARRVRQASFPATLPVIDIVAEKSWGDSDAENAAMKKAHADFVAASPSREAVFAAGSSHQVMRDRPDIVLDAVKQMIQRVRDAR